MTHLWVRAESRANESRAGVTPAGVRALIAAGLAVSVERSPHRILPDSAYAESGATLVAKGSWPDAPADAFVFGLKELPESDAPLSHRHIMFGHAFKGQPAGQHLLRRFRDGGGTLFDLEYLTDDTGRRVAAFGYWAGYAGAAVTLRAWAAQQRGETLGPVGAAAGSAHLLAEVQGDLVATGAHRPDALIVGALGRVGTGVADFCTTMGVPVTRWDIAETSRGGPFPEILQHGLFFNCVLATPDTPAFVAADAVSAPRALRAIGDIACDPDSAFSPVKVYDRATTWSEPVLRVATDPSLDVMAIDNLPSLLPLESSEDFAGQLLPVLQGLKQPDHPVWTRAGNTFRQHVARL